jgi:hypothetical protein
MIIYNIVIALFVFLFFFDIVYYKCRYFCWFFDIKYYFESYLLKYELSSYFWQFRKRFTGLNLAKWRLFNNRFSFVLTMIKFCEIWILFENLKLKLFFASSLGIIFINYEFLEVTMISYFMYRLGMKRTGVVLNAYVLGYFMESNGFITLLVSRNGVDYKIRTLCKNICKYKRGDTVRVRVNNSVGILV